MGDITTQLPVTNAAIINAYRTVYPDDRVTNIPEEFLNALAELQHGDHFLSLVQAEIACGLYLEIHKRSSHEDEGSGQRLITLISRGLEA